jgi:hypothetical protein
VNTSVTPEAPSSVPERVVLVTRDYGNGIKETTVIRVAYSDGPGSGGKPRDRDLSDVRYTKTRPTAEAFAPGESPWWVNHCLENGMWVKESAAETQARREASLESSAKRSKRNLRRQACAGSLNTLATLTYRENMQDRDRAVRDHKEWCRRMRRHIPGFVTRTVPELQKRGAIHLHMLIARLPTWVVVVDPITGSRSMVRGNKLASALWNQVCGDGNFDAGEWYTDKNGVRHRRKPSRSPLAAICYATKYVGKALGDLNALGDRRFLRFGKVSDVKRSVWSFGAAEFDRALSMAREQHAGASELQRYGDEILGLDWSLSFSPPQASP